MARPTLLVGTRGIEERGGSGNWKVAFGCALEGDTVHQLRCPRVLTEECTSMGERINGPETKKEGWSTLSSFRSHFLGLKNALTFADASDT